MPVRWMLASLAAVLAAASVLIAARADALFAWALVIAAILWLGACRDRGRAADPVRVGAARAPGLPVIGVALTLGALLAFPVHRSYYEERYWAEQGGGVGRCHGIVPLAEAVRMDRSELRYTPVAFSFGCDD